ncbi:MAG: prolipoprotein diacylglyceryl transferase family protein [bacterium]
MPIAFPINLTLGAIVIPAHPIFEILAFFVGIRYYLHLKSKQGDRLEGINRLWVILGAMIGSLFGSRLLGTLNDPVQFFSPPNPLYFLEARTIVGGLLGGMIGVEVMKWCVKEKQSSGDLFVFPLVVAIGIGRIGCFLTGVSDATSGLPSSLPWAFPQGDGIPRHPTALYEIIFLIGLFFLLNYLQGTIKLKSGGLFKLFMVFYLLFRLCIDFIKPANPLVESFSSIQVACILGLLYYLAIAVKQKGF